MFLFQLGSVCNTKVCACSAVSFASSKVLAGCGPAGGVFINMPFLGHCSKVGQHRMAGNSGEVHLCNACFDPLVTASLNVKSFD